MNDTYSAILVLLGERGKDWELLEVLHERLAREPFYSLS